MKQLAGALLALSVITGDCAAAPFVPTDPKEVLETLPEAPADPLARELRQMRRELSRDSHNLELAIRVARRYIARARAEADPRYLGHAQAALAPWWDSPSHASVLVLRATIRQSLHDFPSALADLSLALEIEPHNAQAWLTRATIQQVRGEFAEALRSCQPLGRLAGELVADACWAGAASMTGQAEAGYERLRQALARHGKAAPGLRLWVLTSLGEMAQRQGRNRDAENHFRQALALGAADAYLKAAYADFLIDQERHAELIALLKDEVRADGLLLRLILAEQALQAPGAAKHAEALAARFSANRIRGDSLHRREEARFTLHVLKQPREALRLARENWAVHREPWDTRIYLEAALAAGDPGAARPVLDWLREHRVQDVKLVSLAAQAGR
jgi:tetratricopeptide (TPR) repeat protein